MYGRLESFNNLIQYQFEGNQHLVYVVIRRRQIFTRLMGIASSPLMEDEAGAATNTVPQVVFDPGNTVPTTPVGQNHPAVVRSSLKKDGHDKVGSACVRCVQRREGEKSICVLGGCACVDRVRVSMCIWRERVCVWTEGE